MKRLTKEDLEDIADLFNDAHDGVMLKEVKPNPDALHTKAAVLYAMKRLRALANHFYDKAHDTP